VEEIISLLKRSSLPTVLVEGDDEITIFRWIEEQVGTFNANILPCGGRTNLFKIFDRRNEFPSAKIIFLADKDMWLFTTIPKKYSTLIWTEGYSIENDLFIDSESYLLRLLESDERKSYRKIISLISIWFAFEIQLYRNSGCCSIDHNINEIVDTKQMLLNTDFLTKREFSDPSGETVNEVNREYQLKIRGKLIFQIMKYLLNAKDRKSKYSHDNIFEMCLKINPNHSHLNNIVQSIKTSLEQPKLKYVSNP